MEIIVCRNLAQLVLHLVHLFRLLVRYYNSLFDQIPVVLKNFLGLGLVRFIETFLVIFLETRAPINRDLLIYQVANNQNQNILFMNDIYFISNLFQITCFFVLKFFLDLFNQVTSLLLSFLLILRLIMGQELHNFIIALHLVSIIKARNIYH